MSKQNGQNQSVAKQPVKINTVMMHVEPHLDEYVASVLVYWYGNDLFPGIKEARRAYSAAFPSHSQEWLDQEGILPLGCGRPGLRFNDHTNTGNGRVPGHCCTSMVLEYLNLGNSLGLKALAKAVLEADTKNVPAMNLGSIVKMTNRYLQGSTEIVFNLTAKILHDIVRMCDMEFGPVSYEKTLMEVFEELIVEKTSFSNKKANEHIKRCFAQSSTEHVLELAFIVKAMFRTGIQTGKKMEEVRANVLELVTFVVEIMYKEHTELMTAVDYCREHVQEFWFLAETRDGKKKYRGGVIKSDHPRALAAMLYLGYRGVIVRNSKGLTQIHTHSSLVKGGVKVANIARAWRWYVLPAGQKEKLTWEQLGTGGTLDEIPEIHLHTDAGAVYNGTLTHPDVRPTGVSLDALVTIMELVLTDRGLDIWLKNKEGLLKSRARKDRPSGQRPQKDAQLDPDAAKHLVPEGKQAGLVVLPDIALPGATAPVGATEAAAVVAA